MNELISVDRDKENEGGIWMRLHKDSALIDWIMNCEIVDDNELLEEVEQLREELGYLV